MRYRYLGLAILLVLAVIGVGIRLSKVQGRAPEVWFNTLQGERIALHQLRGRPVLVTFWATNCPTCREEVPELVALYRDYAACGLELIAVAMAYDIPSRVVEMAREQGLPYTVVYDVRGGVAQAFGGVVAIPAAFLISPQGEIAWRGLGRLDLSMLRSKIDSLMHTRE